MSGFSYDTSGNVRKDPDTPVDGISYDAENRQTTYTRSSGQATSYSYDGDGRRVKKLVGTATTVFVYKRQGRWWLSTPLTPFHLWGAGPSI
jgi:YD repeat-containing protein